MSDKTKTALCGAGPNAFDRTCTLDAHETGNHKDSEGIEFSRDEEPSPVAEAESTGPTPPAGSKYFKNWWARVHANYGCPHCDYATLDGDAAVEDHIRGRHPEKMTFEQL